MDRRTLLALLLTAIVIVATPLLFRAPRQTRSPLSDSSRIQARDTLAVEAPTPVAGPTQPSAPAARPSIRETQRPATAAIRAETTLVRSEHAVYAIVSPGATPASVTLPAYRSLRKGASRETHVSLLEPGDRLFRLRLVGERDTIALDTVEFRAGPQQRDGKVVTQSFTSTTSATPISLTYRIHADSFVARVDGSVGTAPGASPRQLLVSFPSRIRSEEADIGDDTRHLAMTYRTGATDVRNVAFKDLDSLVARVDTGAIRWVAQRNKYFVVAVVPSGPDSSFRALVSRSGSRSSEGPTAVQSTAILPLTTNTFALRVYAGPQSWDHLRQTAKELENVNPYGGWLHKLVQPFATIVMRLLLWMRDTFNVGYGWVLIIFGVLVRLLLWPLNQNAMRSSMKMQRLQPELAEIQKKYRDNPEKQRDAMMKLYQQHGMSPFTPVLGCLPMLLPMPILFALYFVFQNTIELRGVSFMWMPDLSLKDPLYITPLFMGISMFVLSWIGMRGMPPSPQGKMMSYVMPVMFTVLFWNFASGLNLYYAVQNVAALPQQWLLARERVTKAPEQGKGTKRERA